MASLAVVYLSRAVNGKAPLDAFIRAYRQHSPGTPHDLVILMKGYEDFEPGVRKDHASALKDVPHQTIDLPDLGFDIGSYRRAAKALPVQRVVFLNSYSRPLSDEWLLKMNRAVDDPGVGLAGATGNWESLRRDWMLSVPFRGWTQLRGKTRMTMWFPGFPNPHVRTNAFIVNREMFLQLSIPEVQTKEDSWRFESGWHSMTRQVAARRLRTVIVGADGLAYDPPLWASSNTFRGGEQENLLIADNQTDQYATGDGKFRRYLEKLSWDR